jgi:O-acetyl-ADP-ribose deacetylase (regulator of RNase III)
MEIGIGGVTIECVQGDIAAQEGFAAVVNAANSQLRPGAGVAGAIHAAAGPGLDAECRIFAPIRPGQAVITGGHALPNPYVIHCLGPVYGEDVPEDEILARCYRNALQLADAGGLDSIAFPALSTGIFGYPVRLAARVALKTILLTVPTLRSVKRVRMVLYKPADLKIHEEALKELTGTV